MMTMHPKKLGRMIAPLTGGLILVATVVHASVPRNGETFSQPGKTQTQEQKYPSHVALDNTRSVLGMPLRNRLEVLQAQGPEGYRNLVRLMFNSKMTMDVRWRATTAAGRIGGKLSIPELERALRSPEWFMRNAGLVAMSKVSREKTIQWSRELLSDNALVVRSAAVDLLERSRDAASTELLWQKLYSKENFKGKQSLFIRRRIVEALARIERPGQESKFIELLTDKDEALHSPAIVALERLTQKKMGTQAMPLKDKRAQWQQWWSERSRL